MAWWEWVPIVKTIGHGLADPPGRSVSDYNDCRPSGEDCEGLGKEAAELKCAECIRRKLAKFVSEWLGTSIGADFFEGAASATAYALGSALAKQAGGTFLGLSSTAWTGVGAVLAADALIDAGILLKKALDMWKAANRAIDDLCKC